MGSVGPLAADAGGEEKVRGAVLEAPHPPAQGLVALEPAGAGLGLQGAALDLLLGKDFLDRPQGGLRYGKGPRLELAQEGDLFVGRDLQARAEPEEGQSGGEIAVAVIEAIHP